MPDERAVGTDAGEIVFGEGLIGVPRARRFRLLQRDDDSPIRLLVCNDIANFRLPVIDPYRVDPRYRPVTDARVADAIGLQEDDPLLVLAITIVDGDEAFANLRAPLLINARTCAGVQWILDDPRYDVRMPVAATAVPG